jgi:hypothetical protein
VAAAAHAGTKRGRPHTAVEERDLPPDALQCGLPMVPRTLRLLPRSRGAFENRTLPCDRSTKYANYPLNTGIPLLVPGQPRMW